MEIKVLLFAGRAGPGRAAGARGRPYRQRRGGDEVLILRDANGIPMWAGWRRSQ